MQRWAAVARAVIEIGAERTSLLVAESEADGLTPLLERHQDLVAARLGARVLASVVESEAALARQAGATSLHILVSPELRGSHLSRGLERRLQASGLGAPRMLTAVERGGLAFRGATSTLNPPAGAGSATVAVVEVGMTATTFAVGRPGRRPHWWASRPLNGPRLVQAALRADPPSQADQTVGLEFARAQLATLKPPSCDRALLGGRNAGLLALLCGETIDAEACRRAGGELSGQLSEIVAARLDIAPPRARRLPALLTIAQAAGELLAQPLKVAHGGLAEGFLIHQAERIGSHERA